MLPLQLRCFGSGWLAETVNRLKGIGELAGRIGNLIDSELGPDVPGSKTHIFVGILKEKFFFR